MLFIKKLPFYIFLIYPIFGYFTIKVFGFPPFYILSPIIFLAFIYQLILKPKLKYPLYLIFYSLYFLFVIISKYFAHDLPFTFDANLSQLIFIISALLLFLIIENSSYSQFFIRSTLQIMKILVIAAAFVSVIQYFMPNFFLYSEKYTGVHTEMQGYARRVPSIFTWGDFLNDTYLAIGFIIFYSIIIYEYKGKRAFSVSIIFAIIVGIVVFISQFRVAMLTYLIATISLAYKRISIKTFSYFIILGFAFYLVTNILNFNIGYFVENRLKSETAYTRIDAFRAFFYAFPENPYFGTGGELTESLFEGFGERARLHNAHLAIAYYYGIFASIFHTLFIVFLLKKTYKTGKEAKYWPPFVGVICYIAATMTMPRGEFFEPGLIIMMVFNKYYYDIFLLNRNLVIID